MPTRNIYSNTKMIGEVLYTNFWYLLAQFTIFRIVDGMFTRSILSVLGIPKFIAVIIWGIYLIGGGIFLSSLSRKEQSTNGN